MPAPLPMYDAQPSPSPNAGPRNELLEGSNLPQRFEGFVRRDWKIRNPFAGRVVDSAGKYCRRHCAQALTNSNDSIGCISQSAFDDALMHGPGDVTKGEPYGVKRRLDLLYLGNFFL